VKNILLHMLERTKSFYSYVSLNIVNTDNNGPSKDKGFLYRGLPRFNNCMNNINIYHYIILR